MNQPLFNEGDRVKEESKLIKSYLETEGYKVTRSSIPNVWIARNCKQGEYGNYYDYERRYRYLKGRWRAMLGSEELQILIDNALSA